MFNVSDSLQPPPAALRNVIAVEKSAQQKYEESLAGFQEHISQIPNYLIAEEILNRFEEIADQEFDSREGFLGKFKDVLMGDETRERLEEFSNSSKEYIEKDSNEKLMKQRTDEVQYHWRNLKRENRAKATQWPQLTSLLQLPAIRRLSNSQVETILKFIDREDIGGLREYLGSMKSISSGVENRELELLLLVPELRCLSNMQVKKIVTLVPQGGEELHKYLVSIFPQEKDAEILSKKLLELADFEGYVDSFLGELIEQKPKRNDLWNQAGDYFENKIFQITDPKTKVTYRGTIHQATKERDKWIFKLEGKMEVHITSNFEVTIESSSQDRFWNGLKRLVRGIPFSIRKHDSHQGDEISEGEYALEFADDRTIRIVGTSDEKKYQFHIVEPLVVECVSSDERPERISIESLNSGYTISYQNKVVIRASYYQNLRVMIKDKDKTLDYYSQLEKIINDMKEELRKQEDDSLLASLVQNLVDNKLQKIDLNRIPNRKKEFLEIGLKKISKLNDQFYGKQDLVQQQQVQFRQRSTDHILRDIVIRTVYKLTFKKSKMIIVYQMMELLSKANAQNQNFENRDLILFMGNAGSGKSTSVSYFLGERLEVYENGLGEKNVRVKAEGKLNSRKSNVAQSRGEAANNYTVGHPIDGNFVLGNFHGFNDPRGSAFELCTNLSIDQAVQKANSIRSIILTIPIQAFLANDGNPVIELISTVRERFPKILDPDRPDKNQRVFILITKSEQAQPEIIKMIRDGTRFTYLFEESQRWIKEHIQNQTKERVSDLYEWEQIQAKAKVWGLLQFMHESGQIHVLDVRNTDAKKRLLQLYKGGMVGIDQQDIYRPQYVPAMQSHDMRAKFSKTIEISAHKWIEIIEKYLKLSGMLQVSPSVPLPGSPERRWEEKLQMLHAKREELQNTIEALKKDLDSHFLSNKNLPKELTDQLNQIQRVFEESFGIKIRQLGEQIPVHNAIIQRAREEESKMPAAKRVNVIPQEEVETVYNLQVQRVIAEKWQKQFSKEWQKIFKMVLINEMLPAKENELRVLEEEIQKTGQELEIRSKRDSEQILNDLGSNMSEKRNLALVIHLQKEAIELLRELSGMVIQDPVDQEVEDVLEREQVVKSCTEFNRIYDLYAVRLWRGVKEELNLLNGPLEEKKG